MVIQEDSQFGGIASEIATIINENCFEHLDAPVHRLGSLDTPIPFQKELENQYLSKSRLKEKLEELIQY